MSCLINISGATSFHGSVGKPPEAEGDSGTLAPEPLQREAEQADRQAEAGQRGPPAETSPHAAVCYARGSSHEEEKQTTEPQTGQLLKEV